VNDGNELYLSRTYPDIFKHGSCCECGDGWFNLIDNLCRAIVSSEGYAPGTNYVEQVKEKFGGLRFYVSNGTEDAHDLISRAEDASYAICEYCGISDGVTTSGGWLKSLCQRCRNLKQK